MIPNNLNHEYDLLIIGAGLSGFTLGNHLDCSYVFLEKSRGLGGRFAARRAYGHIFNHGISHLDSESERELSGSGPGWDKHFAKHFDHYDFKGAANQWFKEHHLASVVKSVVKKEQKVVAIRYGKSPHLEAETDSGKVWKAKKIVITCPAPQALALVASLGTLDAHEIKQLQDIRYQKKIFLLKESPPLKSELNDKQCEKHFEDQDHELLSLFHFPEHKSVEWQIKRWRYAVPKNRFPKKDFVSSKDQRIFLIGDYFDFEGAPIVSSLRSASSLASFLSSLRK